ncbi:MAG: hypothetical protein K6F84_00195 [Lachnospiraceae bacterium]|nr:hypothetical protein [Lachnospiraceae bacterium]
MIKLTDSNKIYLNNFFPDIKNDKEMVLFIKESFKDIDFVSNYDYYTSFILSFLSYLGYNVSLNELNFFFGPFFVAQTTKNRAYRLTQGRGANLSSLKFATPDMSSRKALRLTKDGYKELAKHLPDSLKPALGSFKIRRSGDMVTAHDYGLGMSLLSLMLLRTPFCFEKEETHSFSKQSKQRGGLCIDATVYFQDNRNFKLYVEEDMGTEPMQTLIRKIGNYKHLGLTDTNSCIIFSSHLPFSGTRPAFNINDLNILYSELKKSGEKDLYSFYRSFKMSMDKKLKMCLEDLLICTGTCITSKTKISNFNVLVKTLVPIKHYSTRYGIELSDSYETVTFTIEDLKEYIETLSNGTNIFKKAFYGYVQANDTKKKFTNLTYLLTNILKEKPTSDEITCLLSGYPVFVLPSCLLANYSCFFYPLSKGYMKDIIETLNRYYDKDSLTIPIREYSQILSTPQMPFRLRNEIEISQDYSICIEHIGKDLGGYIRSLYFARNIGNISNHIIHLICICNNDEDIVHFCGESAYSVRYALFPGKKDKSFISFVTEKDLSSNNYNLKTMTEAGSEPSIVFNKTMKAEFDSIIRNRKNSEVV